MPRPSRFTNPFYALLLVVGVAFAITACAYFVMALRATEPTTPHPPHGLLALLEEYGLAALLGELGVLSVATFGAMATDEYWMRRAAHSRRGHDLPLEHSHEGESLRGD